MEQFSPFSVPFFYKDCDFFEEIKKDLIDLIMKIHEEKPFELQGSFPKQEHLKQNITESNHRFFAIDNEIVSRLKNWIGACLIESYKKLNIETKKITFSGAWFHVAKKGGFHNFHFHADTPLAGILYIQSGNCERGNRWINPIPTHVDKYSSKWSSIQFDSNFVPGRLLLFPGWLLHSALPHPNDDLRIVIAFNSKPE